MVHSAETLGKTRNYTESKIFSASLPSCTRFDLRKQTRSLINMYHWRLLISDDSLRYFRDSRSDFLFVLFTLQLTAWMHSRSDWTYTPEWAENSQRTKTSNRKSSILISCSHKARAALSERRQKMETQQTRVSLEGIVIWESYTRRWENYFFMVKDKCAVLNRCRWLCCFYFVLSGSVWCRFSRDSHLAYVIVPDKISAIDIGRLIGWTSRLE